MSGELPTLRGDGRPAALLRKLAALGLRGRDADARALLGGAPAAAASLEAALAGIEALEAADAPTAWSRALKGRLLFLLRRTAGARAELDAAIALDHSLLEARVWRAQASLALRDAAGALSDLDALEAARRPSGWEDHLRGLSLMTAGRAGEAEKPLRSAVRRGGGARSAAFLALALAEQRRTDAALRTLRAARRRTGASAVPLAAFEGMVRRQAGDLEGALRALIRASRGPRPYPWVFSHRADVHNRMGFYQQALVDIGRFHALLPREASAFAQAANVLYDQAYYDEALAAMKEAAALAPRDADLRARRAQILASAGRMGEAARELRAALRSSPGNARLRHELVEAALMSGQAALARAELSRGGLSRTPFGRIARGTSLARAGRRREARALFDEAAAALLPGDPLRERALFYAAIMRALPPGRPKASPGLRLCGVGVRHPFQLSVETLAALASSRTIFTNLPDIEARRFLALFPAKVVSVPRRPDQSNRDRAEWVARRLTPKGSAAFLTRIHPFVYRRMGWELLQLCRAKGVPVSACGAVSLTELAGCRAVEGGAPAGAGAVRVFDIAWLNRHPKELRPADPAVVYCIGDDKERPRLVRLLRRAYPASGGAFLLGGSGDREDDAPWVPWRRLAAALRLGDIGCVLYIPAARAKRLPLRTKGAPLVRLHGLGARVPEETTLETLAALSGAPAAFAALPPGPEWRRLKALCPGLRRAASPAAVVAAAERNGEAVLAVRAGALFDDGFVERLLAACRRRGAAVRLTPFVSPIGAEYARAGFCLGGDYGYQALAACSEKRLRAEPERATSAMPFVVHSPERSRLVAPPFAPAFPDPLRP